MIEKAVGTHAEKLFKRFPELEALSREFYESYTILETSFFNGGTLFVCGNGGSASDGEHIVGELMKGFLSKRPLGKDVEKEFEEALGPSFRDTTSKLQMGLRAISLNNHASLGSAYINDVDPYMNYAQQLFVLGRPGDVFMGISCSGGSKNVLNGFKVARAKGLKGILLTGSNAGACEREADVSIKAPAKETFIIQEYHLPIYHALCAMLEERFYGIGG